MSKLAELEQLLAGRPDLYTKRVEYFPGGTHTFHSVNFLVAPKETPLEDASSLNLFMASLLEDHPGGRDFGFYERTPGIIKLGHTEYDEPINGVALKITTKAYVLLDPELTEQAKEAGGLDVEAKEESHPLARRIYIRPYPTKGMAGFVAAYEGGVVDGNVKGNNELTGLRREMTMEQLAEVVKGNNPFARIVRTREGYYTSTASRRAMMLDFSTNIKDFAELGKILSGAHT